MQNRRDAGQERFRTGEVRMLKRRDPGMRVSGLEGIRKGGIRDWRDSKLKVHQK